MSTSPQRGDPFRNRLLAGLGPDALERLRPHLHPIPLEHTKLLLSPGERIESVYFPEAGVVSLVAPLDDGGSQGVEVGMVGREGLVGLPVALGAPTALTHAEVQLPGHGYRLAAAVFAAELDRNPDWRLLVLRFVNAFHGQVGQTAACNGRHPIVERLARWLLIARDRFDSDQMPLTQEYIALMLGVRRPGVTVAAGTLQKAGLIEYRKGMITVLDRAGLEHIACECYRMVRDYAGQSHT